MPVFTTLQLCLLICIQLALGVEVRLAGGRTSNEGRLEVRKSIEEQWGTVCDDEFDKRDASVVCRMLGFVNTENSLKVATSVYGGGSGRILLDELGCIGNETSLSDCSKSDWGDSDCDHSEDVGVSCQTPLKLVDGPTSNSGRVEIKRNGTWESVCFDTFNENVGKVICRMLAFSTGKVAITAAVPLKSFSRTHFNCTGDEKDVSLCPSAEGGCSSGKAANVDCRTEIRLRDGPHNQSGRVEIFFQNEWGTVCDDSFDDNTASVICRMLGYNPKYARARGRAAYGKGTGRVLIDELRCTGSETDIAECKSNIWGSHTNCGHEEDAAVECGTEIRLIDGPTSFSGRLEIKSGNNWNTMCDNRFDNKTARVVCNMLGFERGNITVHPNAFYGQGSDEVSNYRLECAGNETDIVDCKHTDVERTCTHAKDVGINCYSITPIRLQGGPTPFSGRVEVYMQMKSAWIGICYKDFNVEDARVLCRMLGKPNMNPSFHNATGLYDYVIRGNGVPFMNCTGSENDISDCRSGQEWSETFCSYPDYVGINCDPVTKVRLVDGPSARAGRVEIHYNDTWGTICSDAFDTNDSSVICTMLGFTGESFLLNTEDYRHSNATTIINNVQCKGGENDISDCRANSWMSETCNTGIDVGIACNSTVRLVNGTSERSGRVEVFYGGKWGTICSDRFDVNAANVICRMVGFRFWNASVISGSPFGTGGDAIINNICCNGTEPDLATCESSPWQTTACTNDVATVDCHIQHTHLRLLNGDTIYSGQVQVFHHNKWGQICFEGFTKANTKIICLTLGYNFTTDVTFTSRYDPYHKTTVSNLACFGNETDISQCQSDDWDFGNAKCGNYRVDVNCLTTVKLEGGRTKAMGRVAVKHDTSWGSICRDNFTEANMAVLCSMFGFNFTQSFVVIENTFVSESSVAPVFIENLTCDGTETDIQQCRSSPWKTTSHCSQKNTAAINCNTPVRLISGTNWRSGRTQFYFRQKWTDICFLNNSMSEAVGKVVCRMMGLSTGKITTYKIRGSSGVNVNCSGTEEDLSRCVIKASSCRDSNVMGLNCVTKVRLINGRTKYMGSVSVYIHDRWETITQIKDDQAAKVVCRMLGHNFTRYTDIQSLTDLRFRGYCSYKTITKLICDGNETDVFDCKRSELNIESCSSVSNGINCQTPLRLTHGSEYQFGQVKLQENNTWYTLCSDGFTLETAYVMCRMLGHQHVRNTTSFAPEKAVSGPYLTGNVRCNGTEADLSQCQNSWTSTHKCKNNTVVHLDCRSNVRLVGGPTKFKGRIEVLYEGVWGHICSSWTTNNAKVMCKMLGYNYHSAVIHSGTLYQNISLTDEKFTVTNLQCVGTEDDITECSSDKWQSGTCPSSKPLEIECNSDVSLQSGTSPNIGYVYVGINDTYITICGDGFGLPEADVVCRKIGTKTKRNATIYYGNKFGSPYGNVITGLKCIGNETDLQECKSSSWHTTWSNCSRNNGAVSVNCRPVTPIRLKGNDNTSGIIEINYGGYWGTLYGSSSSNDINNKDANVICSMLGFKTGRSSSPKYVSDSVAVIRNLNCIGTERDISECSSSRWTTSSYTNDKTIPRSSVECTNKRVRLVNGVNDYQGTVQFQYIGLWGTICDKNFDLSDGIAVCRQIGITSGRPVLYNTTHFGKVSSSLIIDDLKCTGTEEDLDECASYPWIANNFSCIWSQRSVGINCRPKTPIKLVNGSNSYSGRVEIEYKGSYGTVCDRNFDENDAKVVCRMLGYSPLSVAYHKHAYYGLGSNKITISHLQCDGSEIDISECRATYRWDSPYAYCTHENDVSVQCNTPVRLRGGWTLYDGLVEVFINGSWKSACYEGFTQQDAQTVCRIAGQKWKNASAQNVTLHQGKYYGIISVSEVGPFECHGTENDLYECGYSKWSTESKSYVAENSVAVNCRPTTLLRLMKEMEVVEVPVNKNHSITGRVEVFYENEWGSICDDQFDDSDAQVLCNMLGIPYGKVHRDKDNGKSSGNILIDDLHCLGTEKDVSECKAREWGTHNCRHDEDVEITCEYKTNPCKAKASVRLPNLELRYVNVNTTRLPQAINDSRLPFRWYNVGNNTMPVKPPLRESCGTHLPIYSTNKDETLLPDAVATIKAAQVGDSRATYEIEMKNCFGQFYVYRLRPTNNDASGYCFGIGSEELAPSFVPKSVSAVVHHDAKGMSYICKFEPSAEDDFYYQVQWQIEGNSQLLLTKQYFKYAERDELRLTEQDFEDNDISLGVNISCAVRAFVSPEGQPGLLSDFSKPSFFGIKILTPTINLRIGETKSVELLNTVPIICHSDNEALDPFLQSSCHIRLEHRTPDFDTCENAPAFKDGCDTKLTNGGLSQITRINISTAETGQYGVAGHFKIYLSAEPKVFPIKLKLWRKVYKLPVINVEVLPETDKRWRGSVCSARNDPHMFTFDQKLYEHHENGGEYILYRNKDFDNVEVQHKITSCTGDNSTAKCNCGVAVRAGRDVFVINVCGDLLDIGHKSCGDEVLTVKKDNDFTYTVYLPFGTAVRARIDNQPYSGHEGGKVLDISILPSVHDKEGKSVGLCGTLNSNPDDDFRHKDDRIGTVNRTHFIESWKVLENESLFTRNVEDIVLKPWVFPLCTCKKNEAGSPYSCERSVSDCTPGMRTGQHSCGAVSSRRSVRSVTRRPSIPLVRRTRHYTSDHKVVKRQTETFENWNEAKAKNHCTEYFSQAKTFNLCKRVPSTHTNVSLENCILDILLTNNSGWAALSKQSMQDTCKTEIHRNASVRQEVVDKAKNATKEAESGSNIGTTVMPPEEISEIENLEKDIQTITEIACLNDCSGKGNCSNGVCVCQQGYGASDCSLDINEPPRLQAILHNGLCDEKDEKCTHIYVFGEIFVGTNLTCRLHKFNMRPNETRILEQTPHTVKGTAETLVEAFCPVRQQPVLRKRRSSESEYLPDDFVHGYQVSVSNDGNSFSKRTLDVYVFDSTCQTYTNDSMGMKFNLLAGYCHIEGKCVKNGSLSLTQTVICDTTVNKFNWTHLTTTTTTKTLSTTTTTTTISTTESSNGFTEKDPNSIISDIVQSKPDQHVFRIEIRIGIPIESGENLNSTKTLQKYKNETKTSLEDYYRNHLGLGLTEVVIIALRKGSLFAKHAVIVKNEEFVVKALSIAIADLSNGAKLQLFGKMYGVINVKIDNNKVGTESDHFKEFFLCESYMALHPCQEKERCVLEKETPVCRKTTQDSKTDQGNTSLITIISSTIGAVLVIIIVILIVVICCKHKSSKKKKLAEHRSTTVENQYHDINATEMSAIPKAKLYYGSKESLGLDSPVYKHDGQDQGGESMSARSGATSKLDSGSCHKADDGYIYYFGKK